METFLIKALQLIMSLSLLIIVHELGHFAFARWFGVRIEKFYLFFNPWFSLFRMKKINGKWRFKWFSANDTNIRKRYNYEGKLVTESLPIETLPADNWKKYPDKTEWGIGWLPMGGYVKIAGMIDESLDTKQLKQPVQSWEFRSKKAWQRLLIMVGGVSVNFIAALAIYGAVLFTWGETYVEMKDVPLQFSPAALQVGFQNGDRIVATDGKELGKYSENALLSVLEAKTVTVLREVESGKLKIENTDSLSSNFQLSTFNFQLTMPKGGLMPLAMQEQQGIFSPYIPAVVDSILPNTPAEAHLQKGDRFIAINDTAKIHSFFDLADFLQQNKEKQLMVTLLRSGDTISLQIVLNAEGLFGFYPQKPDITLHAEHFGFWQSIPAGIHYGIEKLAFYVRQLKHMFSKEGISNISGFGGIGSMFPAQWDWQAFWEKTAFLSIILAFMNILPIPALDGGHVLFLLYEVITRRKPSEKIMVSAQMAGMILLLFLFFYANGMDVVRFLF